MKHASRFVRGLVLFSALIGVAAFAAPKQEEPAARSSPDAGVLVVKVEPQSPAAAAGIARGDIILAVDGADVATVAEVQKAVTSKKPGDKVKVTVRHGDAKRTLTAELGELNGRAYLGVYFESTSSAGVQPPIQPGMQNVPRPMIPGRAGAWIVAVIAGSPAEKAGLAAGDLVTTVDGVAVDAKNDLAAILNAHKPGDTVVLAVTGADGAARDVTVSLGENAQDKAKPWLGVEYRMVSRLADNVPRPDGLPIMAGVRVMAVANDSPAAKAGIARGDLLTTVDGTAVRTAQEVIDAVAQHKPGDTLKVGVVHAADSSDAEVVVTLAESPQDKAKAFLGVQLGGPGMLPGPGNRNPGNRTPGGRPPGSRNGLGGTDT
ncbi:MAG: PDZ domain-containing protein [Spirochaetes bacterium]|nr:PDZ domain-containing protein [Spirochaetota bacterium]